MADTDPTLPPTNVQKAEAAAKSVWQWGLAHTLVSVALLSFAAGFIAGKLL